MSPAHPCALITGASAGLGQEFARQLAARGYDLLLVARREERLVALAESLVGQHGIQVETCCVDLSSAGAVDRILAKLAASGLALEMVVNNAGYGVPGGYLSHPWSVHVDFQQVLINAVAELSYRVVPLLRARGAGQILNVASLAGHVPGSAGHTLYAPAKAWLIKFSECLAAELRRDGITVTALCPGFTYTEFHDVNGMRCQVSRLPRWLWLDAESVVRQGLAAMTRREVVFIPGRVNRLLALSVRYLPRGLVQRAIASREHDFRRTD